MPSTEHSELYSKNAEEAVRRVADAQSSLVTEVHRVIVGQDEMIEQMLIALFAGGHCLTIGVPGLAKTLTVSTLARALHLKFSRIQFTPDLMPSDITGTEIIEEDQVSRQRSFKFVRGPVFANIVLADEINRTPPKTQAALLQAMQEYEVTAGGDTYKLDKPFFVMATQNPIEQEGTYPLPEAQLDRFMLSINIGYPSREEERQIVTATTRQHVPAVSEVLRARDILWIQQLVRQIPATDHIVDYAVDLARATRPNDDASPEFVQKWLAWGAGPRAAQNLVLCGKARALLKGRHAVQASDIRAVALPVLRHRIFTNFDADAEGVDSDAIVQRLTKEVPEPSYGEPSTVQPGPPEDKKAPHAKTEASKRQKDKRQPAGPPAPPPPPPSVTEEGPSKGRRRRGR
ncbi:MAG: AAA family ATPase [Planctomycetota bacterium]